MSRLAAHCPIPAAHFLCLLALFAFATGCAKGERNVRYILNLQLVDESGAPLSDVTINSEGYIRRFSSSEHFKKLVVAKDGHLSINTQAEWINLEFTKPNYVISSWTGDLRPRSLGSWYRLSTDPTPVQLTMYWRDETTVGVNVSYTLTHTGRIGDPVIDLDLLASNPGLALTRVTANIPMPKNAVYATLESASGSDQDSLVLHFTIPNSGFRVYIPRRYDDPLDQMRDAPTDGYAPTYVLTRQRLAQLTGAGGVPQDREYLYFRVNDCYGRLRLTGSRADIPEDASAPNAVTLAYEVTLLPPGVTHFPISKCGCP